MFDLPQIKKSKSISMSILLIQNTSTEGFELYESALKRIDFKVDVIHPYVR